MLNDNRIESAFTVTNASGRHINLLNDDNSDITSASSSPTARSRSNSLAAAVNSNSFTGVPVIKPANVEDIVTNSATSTVPTSSTMTTLSMVPSPTDTGSGNKGDTANNKRKYHCTEPGCTKSFTTSGHLARHNRIHTGEKNFPCLFPGCSSRFSRQDNMMQHYRTHMSPKSKRTHQSFQKRMIAEDMLHPRPKLHAHQRIRSDPYQSERPLTIDQHLSNYRRSLLAHPPISPSTSNSSNDANSQMDLDGPSSSVRFHMPTPLSAVAASHLQKQQQQLRQQQYHQQRVYQIPPQNSYASNDRERNNSLGSTVSTSSPSSTHTSINDIQAVPIKVVSSNKYSTVTPTSKPEITFYQYQPLTNKQSTRSNTPYPSTLLHPSSKPKPRRSPAQSQPQRTPSLTAASISSTESTSNTATDTSPNKEVDENVNTNTPASSSSTKTSLLQLAHIVSTFG